MNINSDINILGGLPDWNLIGVFLKENIKSIQSKGGIHSVTAIKTDKSVKRFEKAINATLLQFKKNETSLLFKRMFEAKGLDQDTLLFLFWNASQNNELLDYINLNVFFPAFYSGRVSIKKQEIEACINDLKSTENALKNWSEETVKTTARKYLTLLKKFGLMEGSVHKSINHPYLSDELFVLFIYWLITVNEWPNLLKGNCLQYAFSEWQPFLERVMQKKYTKYFNVVYTGDKLNIEPLIPYNEIYDSCYKS